jgi:PAS domain S-box-containing protein
MDYKAKFEELSETNKRLERELEELRSVTSDGGNKINDAILKIFHSASYLMAISNLETGKYIDVNETFLITLGYTRDEVIGNTAQDIQVFSDLEDSNKYLKLITRLKRIKDYRVTLKTKSGEEKDFMFSADTVQMGSEVYLLTIFSEVTSFKDRQISESQGSVLDEIFETLSSYISLYSLDENKKFRIIDLNSRVEEVEFIKKSEVIGRCVEDTPLNNRSKLIELLHILSMTGDAHKLAASPKGDDSEGYYMGFILTSGNFVITWEPGSNQKNLDLLYKQGVVFERFAELLPEMIYEVDLKGRILYTNQRGLNFFGYTKEDLKHGVYIWDIFPENFVKIAENLKALTTPDQTSTNEYFAIKKDGSQVPIITHSFATFLDNKVIGYRGVITDISRQKEYENQIKREKAFLEHLIDSTPAAIAITTPDGKISMINREFTTLFGYSPEEAANNFIDDLVVPDDMKSEAIRTETLSSASQKEIRQTIRKDKSGRRINVSLVATSIQMNNEVIAHLGIYRDITSERKNQLLQEILYSISTAALKQYDIKEIYPIIVQELSKIWDTNNFFIALYDKESETLSLPFFADEKDNFYEIPTKKTITGWVINNNKPVLLKEHDLKHLEESGIIELIGTQCKVWMGVPLKVESSTIGVMCLQDYNDENKFSQDDLYVLDFIANQIAIAIQRRMMLDNLIHARQKAEEAAQSKQLFMSTMSHEIRTPLNEVIGITNLLLQGNPRDDQMDYIKTLKFSGNHLLTLVNDVLDYNKMESGKIVFEQTRFNLSDFLEEIMRSYSFRSKAKHINFDIRKAINLPDEVIGDPIRLNQILSNLLSNALKFTNQGSIIVTIKELKRSNNQSKIEFEVSDTGIGIPKDKHSVIFDSFTQASPDTTRHFGGTGLGLAICKKLIELQGGTISIESEPGKGSVFRFAVSFGIIEKGGSQTSSEVNESFLGLEGKKILVAEDNKINFFVANKFLTGWGIHVTHAENGQLALDCLEKEDFDLILMDLHMPVMDGIEATKIIRKSDNPKIKNIPIVALTAAIMSENHDKIEDLNINDYVLKPFKPHDLFERIQKHVR